MKKGNLILRTVLSTVMTALGLAVPAMAQEEEPAIERDTVSPSPLQVDKDLLLGDKRSLRSFPSSKTFSKRLPFSKGNTYVLIRRAQSTSQDK